MLQTARRVGLIAVSIFLLSYTAALILEMTGLGQYRHAIGFYIISAGISLVASLGYIYAKRNRFQKILIDLDSRLDLNDTITTAYEYQSMRKASVFKTKLLEDAVRKLSYHSVRQLLPGRYSFIHILFVILILTNAMLLFMDRFSFASKQAEPELDSRSAVTRLPMQRVVPKKRTLKKKAPQPSPKTNRTLEKYTQQLNHPSMTREKMVSSLNEMLQEIQSEHTLLAKDVNPTTQTANIDRQTIQSLQNKQNLSLQRLKELFQGILSDKVSEKIDTDTAMLEEHQRFENLLSQIIDSIDRMESDQIGAQESSEQAGSKTSRQRRQKKPNKDDASGDPNDLGSEGNQPTEDFAGGAYPGQDPDFFGDGEDYREDWEDFSDSPGHAKSKSKQNASDELEGKKGPALQDKTISAKREDYSVHIRSLTSIGKATVEREDVPREYHQEIEGILQKEDIPLNYREYIRNYFISIGLRKDEK